MEFHQILYTFRYFLGENYFGGQRSPTTSIFNGFHVLAKDCIFVHFIKVYTFLDIIERGKLDTLERRDLKSVILKVKCQGHLL